MMSAKDVLKCFKFLDKNSKGHIDYQDFCNLADERRFNVADPVKSQVKGVLHKSKGLSLSAEAKEKLRLKAVNDQNPKDLNELESYLSQINFDDLVKMSANKMTSPKAKAEPKASMQITSPGRVRKGNNIAYTSDYHKAHGIGSYHNN